MLSFWQVAKLLQHELDLFSFFKLFINIQVLLKVDWVEFLEVPVEFVLIMSFSIQRLQLLLAVNQWSDWIPVNMVGFYLLMLRLSTFLVVINHHRICR
jgi:hypothetical protein